MSDIDEAHLSLMTLLNIMADGALYSGQYLAQQLQVSRTAVWKQLAKLESFGISVESVKGNGYRIVGGVDLLSRRLITERIEPSLLLNGHIDTLISIDSTNAYLLRQSPSEQLQICLAEHQSAGRGRRGREWVSPLAKHIYLSLRITLETGFAGLEGLSLAVGVVVVRALTELGGRDIKLKWPNDILWNQRKLGGVLIEVTGDPAGRCQLVVGLGLNVYPDNVSGASIAQPWVSFSEMTSEKNTRNGIAAALLNQLIPLLRSFHQQGFGGYRDEWIQLNAHQDCLINVLQGDKVISGIMSGVTETGALILDGDNGREIFHGGEVSLRSGM